MLKVGQHVVLMREGWARSFRNLVPHLPRTGIVYTIRWLGRAPAPGFPIQLRLVELVNPPGPKYNYEASFNFNRFRPLVKLTTEQFTADLTPLDQHELIMEYEGIRP